MGFFDTFEVMYRTQEFFLVFYLKCYQLAPLFPFKMSYWTVTSDFFSQNITKYQFSDCKFLFTDHQNPQAQSFKINFRMQNAMHQRVNVNAHEVVRINVKTWYGRIFVKKNRSWLFNSSFWRERVVLNDEILGKNQKKILRPVHSLKSSEKPHFSRT